MRRLFWFIQVSPEGNCIYPNKKKAEGNLTRTRKGGGRQGSGAATVKECQQPLEAGRGMGTGSPRNLQRDSGPADIWNSTQ